MRPQRRAHRARRYTTHRQRRARAIRSRRRRFRLAARKDRQLAREIADQQRASQDTEGLDANEPVLRHAGDDGLMSGRVAGDSRQQGRGERYGDARRQRIVAERTSGAEEEHADEPGCGDFCLADDPARLTRPAAGQGANTGIEAEPSQRRGHRLADGQNKNVRHSCLLSPNRFPTSAMVRCGTKTILLSGTRLIAALLGPSVLSTASKVRRECTRDPSSLPSRAAAFP